MATLTEAAQSVLSLIQVHPGKFLLAFLICLVFLTGIVSRELTKAGKLGFVNKSMHGFYYDTDDLRMYSPADREIARQALVTQLSKAGYSYSMEQISVLSDSMLLSFLEPDDDVDTAALLAKMVMILDPTYKAVQASIVKARSNGNVFANDSERQAVFDLLTKYFVAINKPLGVPMAMFSDYVLIKTFSTLKAPTQAELSATPTPKKVVSYDAAGAFASAAAARSGNATISDAMTVTPAPLFSSVASV